MLDVISFLWDSDKINDLSVKLKLRYLVLSSLGVSILLLSIGLYGMWRINDSMVTTYKESVLPLDKLRIAKSAIEFDIIEPLVALKEGKLSSDKAMSVDEMYAQVGTQLTRAKQALNENWNAYLKTEDMSAEEQEMITQVKPVMERALKSIDNAQAAIANKDFMALQEYVGSEMPFFLHNVPPQLDTLMQIQVIKTIALYDDSQITFQRALILVLTFAALGVLALFWITKRIDNNIVASLDRLTINADDLAHNRLEEPFIWTQKDEFGKLGRRIEYTREELNKLIGEIKQNAHIIEKSHESIRQSINYARRIQMSFLPEEAKFLDDSIKDYFIVWNPKDVIGGDCYWFAHTSEGFFMAVIDCTGHGVPGSMMTFVVLSALSRALSLCGTASDPAELLAFINKRIKHDLGQHTTDSVSNDGMDGAFIFIDKEVKTLTYAGANIPLMFIRPNADEVEELRPDKLSVGYVHVPIEAEYAVSQLELESGMRFFITTDGIVDQVGGERSLCFGKKRLKKLLLKTRNMSMNEQKNVILEEFFAYRGNESQRDDNTIIGFEI
jgi:serine phosphatase RsbU (regulator of sigma subunit)